MHAHIHPITVKERSFFPYERYRSETKDFGYGYAVSLRRRFVDVFCDFVKSETAQRCLLNLFI
jgi:hypothetical protein